MTRFADCRFADRLVKITWGMNTWSKSV